MPTEKGLLKVFLCHSSADKLKVRELYRYLRRRGIQPWFDDENLIGGQDWKIEIPKALATSDAIIICLTKNSVNKEGYIQKEIKFALDKALEMPEGRIYLIPVRFEECEVPYSLSRYQWVDLFEQNGFPRLMKSLKTRANDLHRVTVQVPKPYELIPNLYSTSENKAENNISVKVEGNVQGSTIVLGDKNVVKPSEEKIDNVAQKNGGLRGENMYPYDKRKLGGAFAQLMKCRTAEDFQVAMQLPDTSDMGLVELNESIRTAMENGIPSLVTGLCFSAMLRHLSKEDWRMCYVHAGNGFRAALYTNPEFIGSTITMVWPFYAYCEKNNPQGTQLNDFILALGHVAEARQMLANRESADMLGALALAGSAMTTFYERSLKLQPRSGHRGNFAEAISAAKWLEANLGYSGLLNWLEANS